MKHINKKFYRFINAAFVIICLTAFLTVTSFAISVFNETSCHDFRAESETVYKAARAKAVLTCGDTQWKLTESGEAVMNENGLTVPAGIVVLYKSNPIGEAQDFIMNITYSTAGDDGASDGAKAFMYTSCETFGKSLVLNDPSAVLSVAENGDVYVRGEKINHTESTPEKDTLTAKNPAIGTGDQCVLSVKYNKGKLTVTLSYNGSETELVRDYECVISNLKQMQLGGDKTAAKRIENITYKTVSFYEYGDYIPSENTAAAVQSADGIKEYTSAESAFDDVRTKAAAQDETVVELYSDVTLTKPVKLAPGASFTLDLNGYTVNRNTGGRPLSDGYVFLLDEKSSLTVIDSAPERANYSSAIHGGVITGGSGDDVGGAFQLKAGSKLTMNGGSVVSCTTNDHGGAVRIAGKGASVTLANAGFYSNMTSESTDNSHGGAIYADYGDSKVTLVNCIFEGNYSEDNGGAIYVNDGTLTAEGCLVLSNQSTDD